MSDSKPKTDLELVDTDAILTELASRFDNSAFVGKRLGEGGPMRDGMLRAFDGDLHAIAGMLEDLKLHVLGCCFEGESGEDEEEEDGES